jgi:hypothetical protein
LSKKYFPKKLISCHNRQPETVTRQVKIKAGILEKFIKDPIPTESRVLIRILSEKNNSGSTVQYST